MTPAAYVIKMFGGVRKTAAAIGRDPSAVSKWTSPKSKQGTDGRIPSRAQHLVLVAAHRRGLDITADDLVNGRVIHRPKKKKKSRR